MRSPSTVLRVLATLAATSLIPACGNDKQPDGQSGEATAAASASQEVASSPAARKTIAGIHERFSFAVARDPDQPASPVPAIESALGPSVATAFVDDGSRFVPSVPQDLTSRETRPAKVALPKRAAEPMVVRDDKTGMTIEVAIEDVNDAPAEVADGYVVYRGALSSRFAGGDVIQRVRADGVEDYIAIESKPATAELRYRVKLGQGVVGLRLVSDVLEFVDGDNGPILRMAQPWIAGADGVRHQGRVAVQGCAYDADPSSPWGRAVTPPGASTCQVVVSWAGEIAYPALLDPAWTTTGNMNTPRAYHTATTIQTGLGERVLAVGGYSGVAYLSSAELYNPTTGNWGTAASMSSARAWHTATAPNPSSRVYVIGGRYSTTGVSLGIRYYNVTNGTWTNLTNMPSARMQHCAVAVSTGDIIFAGGTDGTIDLDTARLLRVSDGTSVALDPLSRKRKRLACVPLLGGAMFAGGVDGSLVVRETDFYYQDIKPPYDWLGSAGGLMPGGVNGVEGAELSNGAAVIGGYLFNGSSWSSPAGGGSLRNSGTRVLAFRFAADRVVMYRSNVGGTSTGSDMFHSGAFYPAGTPVAARTDAAGAVLSGDRALVVGGMAPGSITLSSSELWTWAPVGLGQPCTSLVQCSSLHCVDGVCCNSACTESCSACSAAAKGQGSNGTCGLIAAGISSGGECADGGADACGLNGKCNGAGACQQYLAGTQCDLPSWSCGGGAYTEYTCNGTGTCTMQAGQCSPYACDAAGTACRTTCSSDTHCISTHYCVSGTCTPKKVQGVACTANNQCGTGFCVDGYCCSEACTGTCKACSAAKKGTGGGANGECGFVVPGHDLDNECPQDLQSTCQRDGTCNGAGACRLWSNVSCGATWCDTGHVQKGFICNGGGSCVNDTGAGTPCFPYLCPGTSCANPCMADSDCAQIPPHFCDAGTCREKLANGQPCAAASQCTSSACVDGYCCNSACSGLCQSCSAIKKGQGLNGDCGPIKKGADPDNECSVGLECQQDGMCNGSGSCDLQAAGTACGGTVCIAGDVNNQQCNGTGACVTGTPIDDCGTYVCLSGACSRPCTTSADCAAGNWCDAGACVTKLTNGVMCTDAAQCQSGNCVDGVCCNSACGAACSACSAAAKGGGVNGECGYVIIGADPDNDCAESGQSTCGNDGQCNGSGGCRKWEHGTSCGSGVCEGNLAKGQICNGTGACIADTVGTDCAPQLCSGGVCASCVNDAGCVSNHWCDAGTCVLKDADATACTAGNQCTSGFCVDGVCCNSQCSSLCKACTAAKKGAGGGADGECGDIIAGGDPDGECALSAPSTCGDDGFCGGSGSCRKWAQGTSCGSSVCDGNTVKGQICNGTGTCVNDTVGQLCDPQLCSGGQCAACLSDSGCMPGNWCDSGTCRAKLATGQTCTAAGQCTSGFCTDGVCCDTLCSGSCRACSAAKKGAGGGVDGECGNVVAGSDPDDDCASESTSTCGNDGQCDGLAACRLWTQGTSCGSSVCEGNTAKGQICNGTGTCVNDAVGQLCDPQLCSGGQCAACVTDSGCVAGNWCDSGTCKAKLAQGQTCTAAGQCTSGFCVDGVCCSALCSGTCRACSAAKKGAGGGADGECGNIVAGNDPDDDCVQASQATCGNDGQCNGSGACRTWAYGTSCGSSICDGNTVKGQICNGTGTCVYDTVGQLCDPQLCSGGQCAACLSDTGCTAGNWCDSGTCKSKLPVGQTCTTSGQCTSGFCTDGVCCDLACTSSCMACSAARKGLGGGADGECGFVVNGNDPDGDCVQADQATCGNDGQCDGSGLCRKWAYGTSCGSSLCDNNLVKGQICNGYGDCTNETIGQSCAPQLCVGGQCAACLSDSGCTSGYWCDSGTCKLKLADGSTCNGGSQCVSTFCADGVCCNSQCSGLCKACSASRKNQGQDGECGDIASGFDPDDECAVGAECLQNGFCSGTGSCQLQVAGTLCGGTVCIAGAVNDRQCNGTGACDTGKPIEACAPYLCTNGSCNNPCASNGDCLTTHWCNAGECVEKSDNGQPCAPSTGECKTNICTDGVCCDKACGGACQACTAALKGEGNDGECGNIKNGLDPDNECNEQAGCGQDGYCNGLGACGLKVSGTACGSTQCKDPTTVVGLVCNGTGTCQDDTIGTSCGTHLCSSGTCQTPCALDTHCVLGHWCDAGTCVPKKDDGAACTANNQCGKGFCVDGVCCKTACTENCFACASIHTGQPDGDCAESKSGLDPHNSCAEESATTCGLDGTCDGNGSCRKHPSGVGCGATTCDGNTVKGKICNGTGSCVLDADGEVCSPFKCSAGGCLTSCQDDNDCVSDGWCNGTLCEIRRVLGAECDTSEACISGFCADGLCCESECKGQCEACNEPDTEGTCVAVTGQPAGSRPKCDTSEYPECRGACNGGDRTACAYPGNVILCGETACDGNVLAPHRCDGQGSCKIASSEPCGAYACDPESLACKKSCATSQDCASGAECDTSNSQCTIIGATCKDAFTVVEPDGTETSCTPYRCSAGTCRTDCDTEVDCTDGYACVGRKCVEADPGTGGSGGSSGGTGDPDAGAGAVTAAAPPESSGCGCRTASSTGRGALPLLALAMGGILIARRRRRYSSNNP